MPNVKITVEVDRGRYANRTLDANMLVSLAPHKKLPAGQAMIPEMIVALRGLADHIEATLGTKIVGSGAPLNQTIA